MPWRAALRLPPKATDRRSPRPPSVYNNRGPKRNLTSRRQFAIMSSFSVALAAPFTTSGEQMHKLRSASLLRWDSCLDLRILPRKLDGSPHSPLRSSAQCTKRREMRSGIKTTNPLLISLEPAIGLEPMTCALRVRCSTTELRRRRPASNGAGLDQMNCIRPATFRVIVSGALHRMVQGERSNRGLSEIASALRASQ